MSDTTITIQSVIADSRLATKELAALSGLPSETIRAWRAGKRTRPTVEGLASLAEGLEKQGGRMLVLAGTLRGMAAERDAKKRKRRKKQGA